MPEECNVPLLDMDVLYYPSMSLPHLVGREIAGRVPRSMPQPHTTAAIPDTGASHSLIPSIWCTPLASEWHGGSGQ